MQSETNIYGGEGEEGQQFNIKKKGLKVGFFLKELKARIN